ncbi:glutathione S-transferase family protein [Paracoccaceae bacterium]|nr:glutathione S-transferase family protein [Paracoccaceae bacterium]
MEYEMDVTLIYLDNPFWRIELARIPLFIGGISFNDKRITLEEFRSAKETGFLKDGTKLPFHQIPCLVVDGVPIAQTGAIARFCGKLSGLYPTEDSISCALIDQFIDFVTDLTNLVYIPSNSPLTEDEKIQHRRILAEGELKRKLDMLEDSISANQTWMVGKEMTIADIATWRGIGWLASDLVAGIPQPYFVDYPKITKIFKNVDNHPKICEWVRKTYPSNYNRGYIE